MTIFWPLTKRVVCLCTHEHLQGTKRRTGPEAGGAGGGGGARGGGWGGWGGWGGGAEVRGGGKTGGDFVHTICVGIRPAPADGWPGRDGGPGATFCFIKGKAPQRTRSARQ